MTRMAARAIDGALIAIVTAAVTLAIGLRFGLGQRWFSFYGLAAVTLAILPFLGANILSAHRERNWRRWPVWLLIVVTAGAALTQIAFWAAFFHAGSGGMGLGIGRALFRSLLENAGTWLVIALATLWLILISRTRLTVAP